MQDIVNKIYFQWELCFRSESLTMELYDIHELTNCDVTWKLKVHPCDGSLVEREVKISGINVLIP